MMRSFRPLAILLGVMLYAGCYYDKEDLLYPNGACDTANVTWSGTVLPLMQARCAIPGCHVPGGFGPGNFNLYNDVKSVVDNGRFQTQVIQVGSMPPSGKLGDCEIQKLQLWIDAGAPNN